MTPDPLSLDRFTVLLDSALDNSIIADHDLTPLTGEVADRILGDREAAVICGEPWVTEVLRQLSGQPTAPARVVLTNYATPEIRRQCMALGAARVFDKSSDIEQLIDYCEGLAGPQPAAGA